MLAEDYLGGTGLGNRIIYDEVPPTTDPLRPENKMFLPLAPDCYPISVRVSISNLLQIPINRHPL